MALLLVFLEAAVVFGFLSVFDVHRHDHQFTPRHPTIYFRREFIILEGKHLSSITLWPYCKSNDVFMVHLSSCYQAGLDWSAWYRIIGSAFRSACQAFYYDRPFRSSIIDYLDHDIRWKFWLRPTKLLWTQARYCLQMFTTADPPTSKTKDYCLGRMDNQSSWWLIDSAYEHRQLGYPHCGLAISTFLTEPVASDQTECTIRTLFISSFDRMTGHGWKCLDRLLIKVGNYPQLERDFSVWPGN